MSYEIPTYIKFFPSYFTRGQGEIIGNPAEKKVISEVCLKLCK